MLQRVNSVYTKIESCKDCLHCRVERDYAKDYFETNDRWDCMVTKENIRRNVVWSDRTKYIPKWCPLTRANRTPS